MKLLYFSLILLLISFSVSAQNLIIKIDKSYSNLFGDDPKEGRMLPIFKLNSDMIHNKRQSAKIKRFPSTINKLNTAYSFISFTGAKNSIFPADLTVLIENYATKNPILHIDRNGNLDFTDDGKPVHVNSSVDIGLKNSANIYSHAYYKIYQRDIEAIKKKDENFESKQKKMENFYKSRNPKNDIVPSQFWLVIKRLSIRFSKGMIDNKPITILIHDTNMDALYTSDDEILVTDRNLKKGSDLFSVFNQAVAIKKNIIFSLYGNNYSLEDIPENGDYISISRTDKKAPNSFKIGSDISSFGIRLLDGKLARIRDLLKKGQHLLIDVGGTWCGGCVAQEPNIKKLYNQKKANVIGVFDDNNEAVVSKYISKHQIKWPVALMSTEFKNLFGIKSYPTYILVSPEGKIVSIDFKSEKVLTSLNVK